MTMTSGCIVGTCRAMCPIEEIQLREREGLLHKFEIQKGSEGTKYPAADPGRVVKEYSRPAAGCDPSDPRSLRPPDTLLATVQYLALSVAGCRDIGPWSEVYAFVFDRLRAVRQDLVIQAIEGPAAVHILQVAVTFHMYAAVRLSTAPPAEFDRKINDTHTQECLKRLLNLYLHRQTTPPCQGYSDKTVQNSKDQSSGTPDLCSNLMKLELSSSDTGGIKDTNLSKQESITDSKIVDPMKDGTFLDSTIEDCIIQESRKYNTAVERGCKETVASDSTESARQCTCRQSEFVAAYLLYNLGNPEAVAVGYEWRPKLKSSYTFGVAMDICRAFAVRNYVRVLRLTGELPPLLLCAIHPHLDHVRRCQLKLMSHGYASKALKYPLSHLAQLLRCDDVTEAANLCQEYGLEVEGNSVRFSKAGFRESQAPPTTRPPSAWVSFQLAELPLQDLLLGPYCGCLNVYAT